MTIPETTEGKYFYDANGNGIFDTGEFYVFIDHAEISGDIILNTAEQDSVVGKSVPTTAEIVFKIETNIGTQIPGACVDIEVLDPNSVKLTTIDGQILDDVTILGTMMFVSDMPAGPTTTAPPYADALDLTNLDIGTYKVRFKLDKTTCNMLDVSSSEMEFTIRREELSIDVEEEVVSRGEDIIVNIRGNPETYYYLIITDVIEEEPPSIEFAGDVVDLPDAGEPGAENVSVDIDNDGVYDHFLASWIRTGADGIATVRIDTTDADERTYTIRVYHNPVEGDSTPLLNPGQPGGPEWATERGIAGSEDEDKVDVEVVEIIVTFDRPPTAAIGERVTIRGTISAGETVDIIIEDGDRIVAYFDNVPVDENNEFEVDWDRLTLTEGSYTINVFIDCDCSDFDCIRNADLDPDAVLTFSPTQTPTIDTGESPNPYPSIFGTHNGTIVPANNITVSKIFVYPCVGTGGHAEYVRIWGNGVDAHATWNGYGGEDWNILHFNRTFTLEAGKEYNFTIKTGSYPQIFHEEVLETLDGSIVRCEEFVDANGKRHKWIPAFKIYA